MENYNYYEAMEQDIKAYLEENADYIKGKDREELYDLMFLSDAITGNASGSYTFNTWKAEENICHNLELLKDALDTFGDNFDNALEKGAEYCDVTIRCYLLGEILDKVLGE